MKPVSIEYVSLQGKNAQEMVQPFFWQRVKPNDVKQEKAGGIDFAFARIKSSFEEHAVDFLASNEKQNAFISRYCRYSKKRMKIF